MTATKDETLDPAIAPAVRTKTLHALLRETLPLYADDRPFGEDIAAAAEILRATDPQAVVARASSA